MVVLKKIKQGNEEKMTAEFDLLTGRAAVVAEENIKKIVVKKLEKIERRKEECREKETLPQYCFVCCYARAMLSSFQRFLSMPSMQNTKAWLP